MNREEWFYPKWKYLKKFLLFSLVGFIFLVAAVATEIKAMGLGALLMVPLIFWLVLVPLLHWKDRYIGEKSTLWGALILIETSGWLKLVYWFRHVLPDWRKSGRYKDAE